MGLAVPEGETMAVRVGSTAAGRQAGIAVEQEQWLRAVILPTTTARDREN